MSAIISIVNQKGGTGKTTSVISLAFYFARLKKRVLIVDLDPQANASISFDICQKDFSFSTAGLIAADEVSLSDVVVPTRIRNLYLAPADFSLGSVDINIANDKNKQSKLKDKLMKSNVKFDYVFIDCPPSLGLLVINALVASKYVLIPTLANYFSLEGLKQAMASIEKIQHELNQELEILGILFCMVDPHLRLSKASINLVKQYFDDKVIRQIVRFYPKFDEASASRETIFEYIPGSHGSIDYSRVAKEILKRLG